MTWSRALDWIHRAEGGYVNDPRDPGGATFAGVSQRAVVGVDDDGDGRLDFDLDGDGDVDAADIAELRRRFEAGDHHARTLVEDFYLNRYWRAVGADRMPFTVGIVVFDAAVNSGVKPAALLLQRALGVREDGVVGRATVAAAHGWGDRSLAKLFHERVRLYGRICARRFEKAIEGGKPAEAARAYGYAFADGWSMRLILLAKEIAR